MPGKLVVFALVITAQPLVDDDVLEPSVQNEVDHALDVAPTNGAAVTQAAIDFCELYKTNGMSATERAIALVSSQRRDGRWLYAGKDVTPVAVHLLRTAAGHDEPPLPLVLPTVPTNGSPGCGEVPGAARLDKARGVLYIYTP